jgi:leader peptidase (prepilin peptidase)/N-methyltransferase
MELLILLQAKPSLFITLVGIEGLLVGSFLNVIIYRLPIMMHRSWRDECSEYLELTTEEKNEAPFNLMFPMSSCPNCKAKVRTHQNIPVISYIFLAGKCANCKIPISIRYPIIEAFTCIISVIVAWHFGYGPQTFFALILSWSLIVLAAIDIDHQLLPDSITLPILWLGLLLSLSALFTDSHSSIIGAIAGYMSLWLIFHLFKLLTGKEGMGFGDFKLLALFGAWLGWQFLPIIILLSSLVGAVVGITLIVFKKQDHTIPIPFGPYLAGAGWLALLWGDVFNQWYLSSAGL